MGPLLLPFMKGEKKEKGEGNGTTFVTLILFNLDELEMCRVFI